ncbi:MAG TPA: SDR family oxidoreductase [Cryptosporangiaceae bacterium]|nr:SDR family oxidoreductase [Cryptosporangiaceae bacterium]
MKLADAVVVLTGATGGIGVALARRFAAEGAAALVLSDLAPEPLERLAGELTGPEVVTVPADVSAAAEVTGLVATTLDRFGHIDLLCSNAGIATGHGLDAPDADWARAWSVNVLAHLHAARAALPSMLERGRGYLLQTCSAAGLLSSPGDAAYAVTKHGAVALAEWLAITYGDAGIRVSALCPQGVRTPMVTDGLATGNVAARVVAASGPILEPDELADAVVRGLDAERFLILPHPEVARFLRHKAADHDRWIAGMRRLYAGISASDRA